MTTVPCTNCGFIPGQHTPRNSPPDLQDLRRRLSSLDATIAVLTAERQKLQAESDAVVYPILSIPTEITAEILMRSCDPSSWDPLKGPLVLTQICHQWREIAIHTPALWCSVHLTTRSSLELLHLWLARSGNAPLNLTLHTWGAQAAPEPLLLASALHAHRWQDVRFALPLASYYSLDLGTLPMLRSASLDLSHYSIDEPATGVVKLDAPLLREAYLRVPTGVQVDLLWSQLTSLTLPSIDLTECISTLRGCPDLVKLSVITLGRAPLHTEPVVLHALESLECNLTDAPVLAHLTLPRLHALSFTQAVEHPNALFLTNCIRRSAAPLRVLSLACHGLTVETLTAYLTAVSDCVSDLELTGVVPAHLLAALTPTTILPHLKVLRLRGSPPSKHPDYQHIIDALHARLRPAPPRVALDEFRVHFSVHRSFLTQRSMPTASTIAQFRALAAAGLKVKFTMSGKQTSVSTHVIVDSWTES
ncbi:hypothetical protein C8R46DRAFT_1346969 [Mycena filopes]|nr:hypothetical protein C8R46DRAFT_1346969 [Mycena filopes]